MRKLSPNPDGSFKEVTTYNVTLECSKCRIWAYENIASESAIESCAKRQCIDATEIEISDFFTEHPGIFDDILMVDALLDDGYNVNVGTRGNREPEIIFEDEYSIGVCINELGIVDHFYVWYEGEVYQLYYSKRYNELYMRYNEHYAWEEYLIPNEIKEEIKEHIARFYR